MVIPLITGLDVVIPHIIPGLDVVIRLIPGLDVVIPLIIPGLDVVIPLIFPSKALVTILGNLVYGKSGGTPPKYSLDPPISSSRT